MRSSPSDMSSYAIIFPPRLPRNAGMSSLTDPFVVSHAQQQAHENSHTPTMRQMPPTLPGSPRVAMGLHAISNRKAQCTHITMIRLYGNHICQMCNRPPNMGWLYACRQDWLLSYQDRAPSSADSIVVPDDSDYFEVMARLATSLKMSQSVVSGIASGFYTFDQVEKLISQKEHLISVIKQAEGESVNATPTARSKYAFTHHEAMNSAIASHGATAQTTAVADGAADANRPASASLDTLKLDGQARFSNPAPCNFMVCHTCRPYLQDRISVTLDSVLLGEQPALASSEFPALKINDPAIVRNLGLRKTPTSVQTTPERLAQNPRGLGITDAKESSDASGSQIEWTSSSGSSSVYDEDAEELVNFDPYPCPGPGACPVYSRLSGCAYDSEDFDDGRKAINHGYQPLPSRNAFASIQNTTPERPRYRAHRPKDSDTPTKTSSSASSVSLPTPLTLPLTPMTSLPLTFEEELEMKFPRKLVGKAASVCGVLSPGLGVAHNKSTNVSRNNSSSSFGSEVEVDGGVALTEEAVGTGVPDIITGT